MRRGGPTSLVVVVLAACTASPPPASAPPSPVASRSLPASALPASIAASPSGPVHTGPLMAPESASADLDRLLELLEIIHPEPFHGIDRDTWVSSMHEVQASLDDSTPEQTMVAVMELVASLSYEGRDGHQLAFATDGGPMLPIRVFEFSDGLFITDAIDPSLVGSRITEIGGRPADEVLHLLEPLVPRDSPASVPWFRPFFLLRADVLEGLGVIEGDSSVPMVVERAGQSDPVTLRTISSAEFGDFAGPLGIIHLAAREGLRFTAEEPRFWTERLEGGTLYARLSEVQSVPNDEAAAFATALEEPDVTRVIFDLRQNSGGDNRTYPYLLRLMDMATQPKWVLIDRATFSAASNLATELEQTTDARFAGEPMGGGLNFWDDVQFVELEHLPIPLSVGISTRYWQKSTADDPRLTIEPDLTVPYTSSDYFAGIDATLDAVLSAP